MTRCPQTLLLTCLLSACLVAADDLVPAQASDFWGELRGQVKDVCGTSVIPGAAITLTSHSGSVFRAHSDGEGWYTFRGLPTTENPWLLHVDSLGSYASASLDNIRVTPGPSERYVRLVPDLTATEELSISGIDPKVRPLKYSVFGTIIGPDGTGFAGARVTLQNPDSTRSMKSGGPCETDDFGRYYVYHWVDAQTPRWILTVESQEPAANVQSTLSLQPGAPSSINIRLRKQ